MAQQAVGLSVGNVLSRTFNIWSRNFVAFTILALVIQLPAILFGLFWPISADSTVYSRGTQILPMLLSFVTAGAVAYGVFQQLRGQPATVQQCLKVGMNRLLAVILTAIVVAVIVGIGYVLLVIPGIIASVILAVAIPVAVVEGAGVGDSIRRSAFLTKGYRMQIFVINLVLGLIVFAMALIVGMALAFIQGAGAIRFTTVGTLILSAILGALQAVATVVVYYELRVAKEQVDLEKIAAVFA
jgi:hypothetical protein